MAEADPYWELVWPESIDPETGEDGSARDVEDDYSEDSFP